MEKKNDTTAQVYVQCSIGITYDLSSSTKLKIIFKYCCGFTKQSCIAPYKIPTTHDFYPPRSLRKSWICISNEVWYVFNVPIENTDLDIYTESVILVGSTDTSLNDTWMIGMCDYNVHRVVDEQHHCPSCMCGDILFVYSGLKSFYFFFNDFFS